MRIKNSLFTFFSNHGKYKAMKVLRDLSNDQLEDIGISPYLLAKGVKAWPWAKSEDNWVPRKSIFQKPIQSRMGNVATDIQTGAVANDKQSAA